MHIHGRTFLCSLLCVTSLVGAIPNFANEKENCNQCNFASVRRLEYTVEKAQWRKAQQMQPMWFCVLYGRQFEDTFVNAQWRKKQTNATCVTVHPFRQEIWGDIWKRTVEKKSNKCNLCDFASVQAGDLRTHLKMHSGEIQTNAIRDGGSTAP